MVKMVTQKIMFFLLACSIALPLHTMEQPEEKEIEEITQESSSQIRCTDINQQQHLSNNDETPNDQNFSLFCLAAVISYIVLPGIAYLLYDSK